MAAFNSTYHTTNYYRYGALSPTLENSLPYDLTATKQTLLSDRLLSPLYNTKTRANRYDALNPDSLLYDDLADDTDRLLGNRLNFLNNSHPNTINNNNNNNQQFRGNQQKPPRGQVKKNNSTYTKPIYNPNYNNNSAVSDDEVLTNKIDRRLVKIPVNNSKRNKYNRGNSENNLSAFEKQLQQQQQRNGNFDQSELQNPKQRQKTSNFNVEILKQDRDNPQRSKIGQKIKQNQYQNENENDENENDLTQSPNSQDNYEEVNNINYNNNDERMFIYREIPKDNPNFNNSNNNNNNNNTNKNNNNNNNNEIYHDTIVNNNRAPLNNKGNSADIDIKTVSSIISSVNHSPEAKAIEAHRQTPYSKVGSKFDSKRYDQNGVQSVGSRDNISTSYSTFRELDFSGNEQNSRKYDPDRNSNGNS